MRTTVTWPNINRIDTPGPGRKNHRQQRKHGISVIPARVYADAPCDKGLHDSMCLNDVSSGEFNLDHFTNDVGLLASNCNGNATRTPGSAQDLTRRHLLHDSDTVIGPQ